MASTPRRPRVGVSRRAGFHPRAGGRDDRGAAMVELALVLPVLVVLLVGIVEAGRAYGAHVAIQGAARDGARLAALGFPSAEVETAVFGTAGPAEVVAVVTTPCRNNGTGEAEVTVQAQHQWRVPLMNLGVSTLNATARMPCEV